MGFSWYVFVAALLCLHTVTHAEHQHERSHYHAHSYQSADLHTQNDQHHEHHEHHAHHHHDHGTTIHPALSNLTNRLKATLTTALTPLKSLPLERAALTASLLTSSVTLISLPLLPLTPHLHNLLPFAAGALISDLTTHILPNSLTSTTPLLLSILAFTLLDAVLRRTRPSSATAAINLAADALHNFCDGLSLGAAFLVSPSAGVSTTIAVILHELPQEIADYALLLRSGFSHFKALLANFLCACTALIGTALALRLGRSLASELVMPFAAGGLMYLTFSSIIPDLVNDLAAPVMRDGKAVPVPIPTFLARVVVAVLMAAAGVAVIALVEATHDH